MRGEVGPRGLLGVSCLFVLGIAAIHYLGARMEFYAAWIAAFAPLASSRHRYICATIVYRMGAPMVIALASACLYVWVHSSPVLSAHFRALFNDWAYINAFFSIMSTMYAISVAFTLWKAMTDYDNLRNTLRDEANKILALTTVLKFFDDLTAIKTRRAVLAVRRNLYLYVQLVTGNRDDGNSNLRILLDRKGYTSADEETRLLNDCITQIEQINCKKPNDLIALESTIYSLNDVVMIRSRRVSCTEARISPYLLGVLAFMSICIIAPFFFRSADQYNINYLIIPSLTFIYSFMILMLIDLNMPFDGHWKITVEAFDSVKTTLKSHVEEDE